jgi:hypothetical protein
MEVEMNVIRRHILYIFYCSMIAVLFCACGVPATEEAAPQSAEATPQLSVFDGTITYGFLGDLRVLSGIGRVTNDQGESLTITVIGQSEDVIRSYFENTRFHIELRTSVTSPEVSQEPIQVPDFSILDLMNNEKSLLIYLDLPQDMLVTYPKGSVYVEVDPEIEQDQYHIYASKNPTSDSVEVDISSTRGSVEGTLYLQGSAVANQTISTTTEGLIGSGEGYFDLAVRGVGDSNFYTLAGTWTYDAEAPVPTGASLTGHVLWGNEPVPGASVQLMEKGDSFDFYTSRILAEPTVSGTDGGFILKDVPVGDFTLCAVAPEGSEYWTWHCHSVGTAANQEIYVRDLYLYKVLNLIMPENNSKINHPSPTFRWENFSGAEYYELSIWDEQGQDAIPKQYTSETVFPLPFNLTEEGKYSWAVNAYNEYGILIAYNSSWYFTLEP